MKRFYIFFTASTIITFVMLLVYFPSTLQIMEGEDLFLLTKEFTTEVLTRYQGFTAYLQDFLTQFFYIPWIGALIYTLVISASVFLTFLTLKNHGKSDLYWVTFFPALSIVYFSFPFFDISLNFLFFALFLYVHSLIKSPLARSIYVILLPIPAFGFITWYESTLLFVVFLAWELFNRSKTYPSIITAVALLLSLFVPRLWSDFIAFVPFTERPFAGLSDSFTAKILTAYLLTTFACIVPFTKKLHKLIGYTITPVIILGFVALMLSYKELKFAERTNKISLMADQKDWYGIISEIPYEDAVGSKVLMDYMLLALNATGNMVQSLFSYPINSPEQFLFRHDQRPFYVNFNRQFYENIGIWDEAFHQAFEYGVIQRENECFRSLRFKTDYALNSHDLGVARYYINLLSKSCTNTEFVESRKARLKKLEAANSKGKIKLPPYRSDTFVGAYLMASEMFRLFERNPKNKKLLDYVLCSLLLNKEVEKFGIILGHFNLYKGQELPRPYAEAIAALASRDSTAHTIAEYDHTLDQYFMDFMAKSKQKQNISEYASTYWSYLMFRQVAPLPDYSK